VAVLRITAARVTALLGALEDLTDPLNQAGALIVARSQDAFREQKSPDGAKWQPRMTPNVPGIVASLNQGRKPLSRHLKPGPSLLNTGRLRRSINWKAGPDFLEVGSNLSYADTMQSGGKTSHTLQPTGRRTLAEWMRTATGRRHRDDLGWLFSQPSFDVEVAARPFVQITADDERIIEERVQAHFEDAANG
jgi:phage gpG-like protein